MLRHESISKIKGIGPKTSESLNKAGIFTLEDLLYFFPNRYEDETELKLLREGSTEKKVNFRVKIIDKSPVRRIRKGLNLLKFTVEDSSARAELVFFNQGYLDKSFSIGEFVEIYGKTEFFKGKIQINSPKISKVRGEFKGKIRPIYSKLDIVTSLKAESYLQAVFDELEMDDFLPKYLVKRYGLLDRFEAFKAIHFPNSINEVREALNRLIFEEFLLFQLSLLTLKENSIKEGIKMEKDELSKKLEDSLNFVLTSGQKKSWEDINRDMSSGSMMQRLIQGDVGSGKTIVAFLSIAKAVENGYQALMMAPTEILARQHFRTALDLLTPLGIQVELLTGSTPKKRRKEILSNVEFGLCDLLIGTHALIEDEVSVPNLGLTITDEQHRFGVEQRERLQSKIKNSHKLVMTATPIPRSLGMILYGDMDISTIDSLPSDRKAVNTLVVGKNGLDKAYKFMNEQLKKGIQAYVVCPLIDENENLELDSVVQVYEMLKNEVFKSFQVGLLHGRMENNRKDEIMSDFAQNKIQVLVSTTVIEVGVNVPNANLLLVYNAERFGLATLHQLRGRIGRGDKQGYCLLYSESEKEKTWERLRIIESSTDGFYISEKDLELRGSGDIFGVRQSGLGEFKVGDPIENFDIMKYAQIEAKAIIQGGHLNEDELPKLDKEVKFYIKKLTL